MSLESVMCIHLIPIRFKLSTYLLAKISCYGNTKCYDISSLGLDFADERGQEEMMTTSGIRFQHTWIVEACWEGSKATAVGSCIRCRKPSRKESCGKIWNIVP